MGTSIQSYQQILRKNLSNYSVVQQKNVKEGLMLFKKVFHKTLKAV